MGVSFEPNASNDPKGARPKAAAPVAPAERQPSVGGDQLQLVGKPKDKKKDDQPTKLDRVSDAQGAQGVVQDSARVARVATETSGTGGRAQRIFTVFSSAVEGDKFTVGSGVQNTIGRLDRAARAIAPTHADAIVKAGSPAIKVGGTVLRVVGKVGPLLGIPFAGLDVFKAIKEKDPTKQDGAWANASISVIGAGLGAAGVATALAGLGIPLLIGSAGLGLLQLADSYVFKGKIMDFLGAHVVAPIRHLFGGK
jgi:hypothetical protein